MRKKAEKVVSNVSVGSTKLKKAIEKEEKAKQAEIKKERE